MCGFRLWLENEAVPCPECQTIQRTGADGLRRLAAAVDYNLPQAAEVYFEPLYQLLHRPGKTGNHTYATREVAPIASAQETLDLYQALKTFAWSDINDTFRPLQLLLWAMTLKVAEHCPVCLGANEVLAGIVFDITDMLDMPNPADLLQTIRGVDFRHNHQDADVETFHQRIEVLDIEHGNLDKMSKRRLLSTIDDISGVAGNRAPRPWVHVNGLDVWTFAAINAAEELM